MHSEPENVIVEDFIIRQTYMGDVPFVGNKLSPVMQAMLRRLAEIEARTVSGERGWHAVISTADPKFSYTRMIRKLRDRGYSLDAGWTLRSVTEPGNSGEVYRSVWASYQPRENVLPPPPFYPQHQIEAPAPSVEPTWDVPPTPPAEADVEPTPFVEPTHVAPPPPIPLRANITPNPSGADPLAGLVFDLPPDAGQSISRGDGDVPDAPRKSTDYDGPRWG